MRSQKNVQTWGRRLLITESDGMRTIDQLAEARILILFFPTEPWMTSEWRTPNTVHTALYMTHTQYSCTTYLLGTPPAGTNNVLVLKMVLLIFSQLWPNTDCNLLLTPNYLPIISIRVPQSMF